MPIDREAALKTAEKLLRQGKLDGAIAEYVRLVEDQPKDWNSINALGDLYARAGNPERAVEQFTRVADHLFTEGFVPKAAALFKKALKTKSDHEPALQRLADIAAQQGLFADARLYLRQLAEQRRVRGDERGAAECLIRLGTLEEADVESKLIAARAAQQLGDAIKAAVILKDAAKDLERAGRRAEALDALVDAAQLDPADVDLRTRLARECTQAGQLDRARLFLSAESAGDDPQLLMAFARIEMTSGEDHRGRSTLTRLLTVSPEHHGDVFQLARDLAESGEMFRAYGCVDVLTDAAILSGQWARAVEVLRWFVGVSPRVPALSKLIEVCVDAGLEDLMRDTQAQLVDAYLAAGQDAEARAVADDLRARNASSFPPSTPEPGESDAIILDTIEIDLSTALSDLGAVTPVLPTPAPVAPTPAGPPQDLESVFDDIRTRVSREQQTSDAATQLEGGVRALDEGRDEDALADLQSAARVPLFRFKAGAALGRLYIGRGDLEAGIEWLERAAEAPAPRPDEGFALLYELADVLELLGEPARALAVLMELDADAGGYRDVRSRIERLTRVQAGSHGG